jgi:hypothetical protein
MQFKDRTIEEADAVRLEVEAIGVPWERAVAWRVIRSGDRYIGNSRIDAVEEDDRVVLWVSWRDGDVAHQRRADFLARAQARLQDIKAAIGREVVANGVVFDLLWPKLAELSHELNAWAEQVKTIERTYGDTIDDLARRLRELEDALARAARGPVTITDAAPRRKGLRLFLGA